MRIDSLNNYKKYGFTLAEILITLGIIGIVVAMTLPVLINNAKESSNIVALNKAASVLEYAFRRGYAQSGSPEFWCDEFKNVTEFCSMMMFMRYTQVVTNCKTGKGCFTPGNYKKVDGSDYKNLDEDTTLGKFIMQDGLMVGVTNITHCAQKLGTSTSLQKVCGKIYVDINGAKKPNQLGTDLFMFYITQYGLEPAGTTFDTTTPLETSCVIGTGEGCTAWAMVNKNFAYKFCEGLTWNSGSKGCDYTRFGWK